MDEQINSKPSEGDFQSALADEFNFQEVTPPEEPEPTSEEEELTPTAEEAPVNKAEETAEPVAPSGEEETVEEKTEREAKEAAEVATEEEAPKYATKEDVVDAMRQFNQETTGRIEKVSAVREEVINKLYPEGIDKTIYDSTGQAIKTAQDIVDRGLINERTREAFTYEEAASFMLEASQRMNKNVEELNDWAEKVAEDNVNLLEGNQRVLDKWGETFKQLNPDVVKQIADSYVTNQLKFDKTNSYITEMTMTPEAFYDLVMAPYTDLRRSIDQQAADAAKAEVEAKEAAAKAKKDEQEERNGIPSQRGTSETKANTGDAYLDALLDEMKKG